MSGMEEVTTCNRCHKTKACVWTVDPFIRDIYPEDENEFAWWCEECHDERHDQI